jgi:hypothetical protein
MTTDNLENPGVSVPAAPALTPKKNVFERLVGVLFSPAETFEDIARRPDILAPMIILLVIGYVQCFLMIPRMDFEAVTRTQIQQSGRQMSEAELEQATRMGTAFGRTLAWISPVLGLGMWAVMAGVLLLVFRMFGGEGDYKQALSALIYAWVPMTIYGIILGIVATARGSIDPTTIQIVVKSNPGFLVDPLQQRVLYALLTSLDIFIVWTLALLTFGYSALSRLTRVKSAILVVSLWLVTVVVKLGFAAMAAKSMKG